MEINLSHKMLLTMRSAIFSACYDMRKLHKEETNKQVWIHLLKDREEALRLIDELIEQEEQNR